MARKKVPEDRWTSLKSAIVRMPVMMGDELVREAMKLRPDLKVVFTSGYTASANRIPAEFPMVPKPYRPRDVIQAFMGLLDNPTAPT